MRIAGEYMGKESKRVTSDLKEMDLEPLQGKLLKGKVFTSLENFHKYSWQVGSFVWNVQKWPNMEFCVQFQNHQNIVKQNKLPALYYAVLNNLHEKSQSIVAV